MIGVVIQARKENSGKMKTTIMPQEGTKDKALGNKINTSLGVCPMGLPNIGGVRKTNPPKTVNSKRQSKKSTVFNPFSFRSGRPMKITQNSIKRKNLNYFSSGTEDPKVTSQKI